MPDNLKLGIENLSGYSMDDVKVHYNSDKPAQLQAHAYAQGTDIHLGAGQEKHLAHEAWHVVQQKQGRVKPTLQMKGKVNVNDDKGLEHEADVMGAKALNLNEANTSLKKGMTVQLKSDVIQKYDVHGRMWLHDTGYSKPLGNERYNQNLSFMLKFDVPNYSIAEWQKVLVSGDSQFMPKILGFLLFAFRPDLAGCSAEEMAVFLEPYFTSKGRSKRKGKIISEVEHLGLGSSLIKYALGGNISSERIENYWNRAKPPSEKQKLNFVAAIMSNSDKMELPEFGFWDAFSQTSLYWEHFEKEFAKSAVKKLVSQYYTQALVHISNTSDIRSINQNGTQFLAEYGDNDMRAKMMAESGSMAMKALDILATINHENNQKEANNAYNLLTNAGSTIQSLLLAQTSVDKKATNLVDLVFNEVCKIVPGGGLLTPIKNDIKTRLKKTFHKMVKGSNMKNKISIFRDDFNKEARNLVPDSLSASEAAIAVNSLFSSSSGI